MNNYNEEREDCEMISTCQEDEMDSLIWFPNLSRVKNNVVQCVKGIGASGFSMISEVDEKLNTKRNHHFKIFLRKSEQKDVIYKVLENDHEICIEYQFKEETA